MPTPLPCRRVSVIAFRGDRSPAFGTYFKSLLDAAAAGVGPEPSRFDCLRYAGHSGLSLDGGATILGFNPSPTGLSFAQMGAVLNAGGSLPGVVQDDTAVFQYAANQGLIVQSFLVLLTDSSWNELALRLDEERRNSKYSYGFPDGDGDCNCTTWMERMGLPLLTGAMTEFVVLPGFTTHTTRRFGRCT